VSDHEVIEVEGEIISEELVPVDRHALAQIDQQIATARKYPRQLKKVAERLTTLCTIDEETAASCSYAVPRDGQLVVGESIRFVELAIAAWGNVRCGSRIVGESEDGRWIEAEGFCHDLESNVSRSCMVRRRITKKNGRRYSDDMIQTTGNAAASIALRNAALSVIPRAFLRTPWLQARAVALGKGKTLTEQRERVFARLRALDPEITDERVLARLGRASIEDVTTHDLEALIGLGSRVKDGEHVDDVFPAEEERSGGGVSVGEVVVE
jgi:hypothetical protein